MDNRFLSRGKSKNNGEWLHGCFLCDGISDVAAIVTYVNLCGNVKDLSEINIHEIIPETAGHYTGLTDKNEKMMFEGDIIRYTTKEYSGIYIVGWDIEGARFVVYGLALGANYPLGDFAFYDPRKCEVIGNMYDNPELKGG